MIMNIEGVNIDINDVFKEFGLDESNNITTVTQDGNNLIINPNETLEPPSIDTNTEYTEYDELINTVDAIASENLLASTSVETILNNGDTEHTENIENTEREETNTPATENTTHELTTKEMIDLLPVNPPSFGIDESTSRFSGASWFTEIQKCKVLLAGLGGIGSNLFYCLARMKPAQVFLYDDDVVELSNLSGQFYPNSMVNKAKVDASAQLATDFSMYYSTVAVKEKFTSKTPAMDIMICGFDNMDARRTFFDVWVKHVYNHKNPEKCLFIDGRLAIDEFQVFCIKGDDTYNINRYDKEYLFKEWEASSTECSLKQTTYCSNMIGAVMTNLFTNFVANSLHPTVEKELPFKTYYNAGMMYFKTEL